MPCCYCFPRPLSLFLSFSFSLSASAAAGLQQVWRAQPARPCPPAAPAAVARARRSEGGGIIGDKGKIGRFSAFRQAAAAQQRRDAEALLRDRWRRHRETRERERERERGGGKSRFEKISSAFPSFSFASSSPEICFPLSMRRHVSPALRSQGKMRTTRGGRADPGTLAAAGPWLSHGRMREASEREREREKSSGMLGAGGSSSVVCVRRRDAGPLLFSRGREGEGGRGRRVQETCDQSRGCCVLKVVLRTTRAAHEGKREREAI